MIFIEENRQDLNVLSELHKGTLMGMNSIGYVKEKIGDKKFKTELASEYNQYDDILGRIVDSYNDLGKVPENGKVKDKMQTWMGIQLNTMMNQSNSKISEMLIQGSTMGIIQGVKLKNHNTNLNPNINNILDDFITMQENTIAKLKNYL